MVRFSEYFWDAEFNGTVGYDCLIRRLKDGKKVCDDFTEFVRQRAKAEEEYGRVLIKLAQNAGGNEEIGTMRVAWDSVKRETESIGNAHCSSAQRLIEEIEKSMKDFRERQKIERLKIDDRMKRIQKEKKNCYDNVFKYKRLYEKNCKEAEAAKEALDSKAVLSPKEEDRLRLRSSKAKTAVESSDTHYQHSVTTLEEIRQKWERECALSCDQFQTLEEERIKFLRNSMWVYTNVGSYTAVNVDVVNEKMRVSLEKCDEVVDIQQFIKLKQTGLERPAPIVYENYYNHSSSDRGADTKFLPMPATPVIHDHHTRRSNDDPPPLPAAAVKGSAKSSSNFINYTTEDSRDSDYSSIQELRPNSNSHPTAPPKRVRAAFDYVAQGDMELTLKRGDIIQVLRYENEVWAYGSLGSGAKGVFPLAFVETA